MGGAGRHEPARAARLRATLRERVPALGLGVLAPPATVRHGAARHAAASQISQRCAAVLMGRSNASSGASPSRSDGVQGARHRLHVGERVGLLGQVDESHAHGALAHAPSGTHAKRSSAASCQSP